jgi:hypothetical protein
MKTLLALCGIVLSACAGGPRLAVDESPELVTFDGMHPVKSAFFDRVWVRTPLDVSKFRKLRIEKAEPFYRYVPEDDSRASEHIEISVEDREAFEARLSESIRDELSASSQFRLVDVPGDDVLTLWGTVVDVNVHTADDQSRVGEFILVVELRDSVTRVPQVRLVQPYELKLDERDQVANWASIERISNEISSLLRYRLDELFSELADGILSSPN